MAYELSLKKRHQYYAQVQMGTDLLNLQRCDFVIYSSVSNSIKIIAVAFDEKYAENLLKTLKIKYLQKMLHEICTHSRVV